MPVKPCVQSESFLFRWLAQLSCSRVADCPATRDSTETNVWDQPSTDRGQQRTASAARVQVTINSQGHAIGIRQCIVISTPAEAPHTSPQLAPQETVIVKRESGTCSTLTLEPRPRNPSDETSLPVTTVTRGMTAIPATEPVLHCLITARVDICMCSHFW